MLTTMRMARLWTLWLAVLTIGAVVPGWALAAGRVLTPQDSVTIKVVNQPDMDTTTRVETDGTISFPYVGRIRAAGLSEDQVAHAIERQLASRQIVTDPHVLVEITTFGTQASVQGQVGAPGVYTLDRPTNLTQLLSRAGGLRDTAVGGTITVRRAGGASKSSIPRRSRKGAALALLSGSPITMRFLSTSRRFTIYTVMSVKPGEFPLLRPLTVQQAISIGGGLAVLGSEWRIKIKRKAGNGQAYEVPASLDDQVEAGDTIIVSERIF